MKKQVLLYNPRPDPHLKPLDTPLALLCISRFLAKDGYPIKIIAENLYPDHYELLKKEAKKSFLMGVSSMTGYQIIDGLKAVKIVKEASKNIKVVFGGWHPSLFPAQTLRHPLIDFVVKGQGEKTFRQLIKKLAKNENHALHYKNIPGLHWKKSGRIFSNADRPLEPVDDFPPIPYHLIDLEKCLVETEFGHRTANYISSFGCPHRCGFCCEQAVNKRRWVGLKAESVLDDLERLEKKFRVNAVSINDSNFFVDIKRVKKILKGMLERKLTLRLGNLNGRVGQLLKADDKFWELLKNTRTYSILVGAESGSQAALDFMKKDMKVGDNFRLAKKCHRYGIKVIFSSLVGLPLADLTYSQIAKRTDREINLTLKMFSKLLSFDSRHRALIFFYNPYPGTPLYQASLKLGFKEPKTLEEWGKFNLYKTSTPWITPKQAFLIPMLSSYIFMLLDSDTIVWLKERIKNTALKILFVLIFKIFARLAHLRWRYKFFALSLDYQIYLLARKNNKLL